MVAMFSGVLLACQGLGFSERPPLRETHWVITSLNGERFEHQAETPFFLELHENGTMSAWAGCNKLHGVYERKGTILRIGPFAELETQCSQGEMAMERRVMRALEGASRYQLEKGELSLLNPIGIEQARLQPRR